MFSLNAQNVELTSSNILWAFQDSREQYRIVGSIRTVLHTEKDEDLQAERRNQWKALSDNARSGFNVPHPGLPRDPDGQEPAPVDTSEASLDPNVPLDNFALLILDPEHVDYLCLKGNPQSRSFHKLDEGTSADASTATWTSTEVNA